MMHGTVSAPPRRRSSVPRAVTAYLSAQWLSSTGSWMQRTIQDWLVLQASHGRASALGLTVALQFTPQVLLLLLGGALADRYSRRMILIVSQTLMALPAVALWALVVTDHVSLVVLFVLAATLGLFSALDSPARQSYLFALAGPEGVTKAISANGLLFNASRMVGPAAGGLLISAGHVGAGCLFNALSFLLVAAVAVARRPAYAGEAAPPAVGRRRAVREGLGYVRSTPSVGWTLAVLAVVATLTMNFQTSAAVMAKNEFHTGGTDFGLASTSLAVGSAVAALLSFRLRWSRAELLLPLGIAAGVLQALAGLMPTFAAFCCLFATTGLATTLTTLLANSAIQLATEERFRGRVLAVYALAITGGTPVMAPVIGVVAQLASPRLALVAPNLLSAAILLGLARRPPAGAP